MILQQHTNPCLHILILLRDCLLINKWSASTDYLFRTYHQENQYPIGTVLLIKLPLYSPVWLYYILLLQLCGYTISWGDPARHAENQTTNLASLEILLLFPRASYRTRPSSFCLVYIVLASSVYYLYRGGFPANCSMLLKPPLQGQKVFLYMKDACCTPGHKVFSVQFFSKSALW